MTEPPLHDDLTHAPGRLLATEDDRRYAMFMHFSSLASYLAPLAGIILPIVLWQTAKDRSPGIDAHGRAVMNFTISYLIYLAACVVLCLVLVGFALLAIWGVIVVVLPVIAALKASNGEYWEYPGSIRFF